MPIVFQVCHSPCLHVTHFVLYRAILLHIAEMSYDQIEHIQNAKFAKGKTVYENYLQDLSDVSAGYSKFRVILILCCASYSYGSGT